MPIEQLEKIGGLITLREGARLKATTTNALWLWLKHHKVPVSKVGRTILVSPDRLTSYERKWKM